MRVFVVRFRIVRGFDSTGSAYVEWRIEYRQRGHWRYQKGRTIDVTGIRERCYDLRRSIVSGALVEVRDATYE